MDTNEEAKFEQFCKSFMGTLNTENMHDLNYNYEWNYFGAFATLLFKHSTELLDEEERVAFRRGFELLDTNRKRFEFAFENERIRKSIEYLVNHFMNVHVPYLKDRKRSVELREKGNKCFKIRGNEEALKFYNEVGNMLIQFNAVGKVLLRTKQTFHFIVCFHFCSPLIFSLT